MATNTASNGIERRTFPEALPLDFPYRTRLSWDLGRRLLDDTDTERISQWTTDSDWTLSVFRATNRTNLMCFRTPVGRELFYCVERTAESTIRSSLESDPNWRRIDGETRTR